MSHAQLKSVVEGYSGIGATQKFVLVALAYHANELNHGWCWPSLKRLSHITGLGPRTVQRALRVLENRQLIEVKPRIGKSTKYRINPCQNDTPTPVTVTGVPPSESHPSPVTVTPGIGKEQVIGEPVSGTSATPIGGTMPTMKEIQEQAKWKGKEYVPTTPLERAKKTFRDCMVELELPVPEMLGNNVGYLKAWIVHTPAGHRDQIMRMAMEQWGACTDYAAMAGGLEKTPSQPTLGFFATYPHLIVGWFMEVTKPKKKPTPPVGFDKPAQPTDTSSKPSLEKVSIADLEAIEKEVLDGFSGSDD